ncbi:hypothetical protein CAPTEDRAFT_63703, partial [Capitella teleta]
FFFSFAGYFPLQPSFCVLWATVDVLLCTASIWHMCTMSMDRFCTLKYPMKYGRNKTKTMVALKITFVWITSIAICCPVCIMGFLDYKYVFNDGQCLPNIRDFVIYGSIFAFYVPLLIMVVTYGLTIQILCNNQKIMRNSALQCVKNTTTGNSSPTNKRNDFTPPLGNHPLTPSTSSTEKDSFSSDHEQARFVTIRLKPSGCYLYRINNNSEPNGLANGGRYALVKTTDSEETPSHQSPESTSAEQENAPVTPNGRIHNGLLSPPIEYPTRISVNSQSDKVYSASAWKAFLHRKRRIRQHRKGDMPQIISKRTASNERKASKVLGIIFAVFIILWTPFFIMNILPVACADCMKALTPPMTASIVWLGYLSSLANPIIYTMFNTAFRHSFYKILTCSYNS